MFHDFTLVLHSRDIAQIGLGDNTDNITSSSPTNTIPAHLQPSTITLRFEIFGQRCPMATSNLSFVANKHLMGDDDIAAAVSQARTLYSTNQPPVELPEQLRESAVHRVVKNESIEFGSSVSNSIFGGTYPAEDLQASTTASSSSPFSTSSVSGGPATQGGYLVVSNFGGPNTNGSRYFITLRPMKEIVGNHVILGKILLPNSSSSHSGAPPVGNGFERLLALLNHPQFKVNARTFTPNNKLTIADTIMIAQTIPHNAVQNTNEQQQPTGEKRRNKLAGKLRGREDDEEAEMLREDFEKGISANNANNVNPFANPAAFGGPIDVASFGAVDSRVRTTKKRRAEAPILSTAPLTLAERERLRTVAVSTAQHFEGHDDDDANSQDDNSDDGGIFADRIRKKVFAASVTPDDLAATYRPVGVNPNQMAQSNFSVFEANALAFSSDLQDVMEQQLERQHNRERRMGRKQKALEKQKQARLGGLGTGGAETSASAALKAALAATAASAQMQGVAVGSSKANKIRSSTANINEKLGRIREKFSQAGAQHSVKAFQERAKAKAAGSGRKSKY